MAKHKTVKTEATSKKSPGEGARAEQVEAAVHEGAEAVAEQVETAAGKAETLVGKAAGKAETLVERAAEVVVEKAEAAAGRAEAVVEKAQAVSESAAEAVKAQASKTEAGVSEAAHQVVTFVKGQLEQAQRQLEQLEVEAHKALNTLVTRGRESSRVVLERLHVDELRERPAVRQLRQKATWVEGEVRQRLLGLRSRMVEVVGGAASQAQVEAINRELDRLTRKLDALEAMPVPATPARPDTTPQA